MENKKMVCICLGFIFAFGISQRVYADELSDLKAQMKAMQKQTDQMQKKIEKMEAEKQARIETPKEMEERVIALEEKAARKNSLQAYWKDGLCFTTEDKKFDVKIGTRIHADSGWFKEESKVKDKVGAVKDDAKFKIARFYMQGRIYEDFLFKLEYDFATGDAYLKDAYIGLTNIPYLGTVKIGHYLEPFGLYTLPSYTFLESNLPRSVFYAFWNLGIETYSTAFDERITWAAGVFREADNFGHATANEHNFTGRLTTLPWYEDEGRRLLHLGISYSLRYPKKTLQYRAQPEASLTPYFVDTGSFVADSANIFSSEAALVYGPFCLQGEYMGAVVDQTSRPSNTYFQGCYAEVSYFLTGEHRPYSKPSGTFSIVRPLKDFSIKEGGLGGWEVAGRYSYIDLNDDNISGGIMSDITIGLNWYLNPNMRITGNYIRSHLNGSGDTDMFLIGFQIYF